MTEKQLEDYHLVAPNKLRGKIGVTNFKQFLFPVLYFKRRSDLWHAEY